MKRFALFVIFCSLTVAVQAELVSLGRVTVTTAGTPVQITSDTTIDCNAIRVIRNVLTETGRLTIERRNTAPSPGDGIDTAANYDDTVGVIAPPSANSANSDAISCSQDHVDCLQASDYYLDAETSTEGGLVVCKQVGP